jgi:hypothetical protein
LRAGATASFLPVRRLVDPLVGFIGLKRFLSLHGDYFDFPQDQRVGVPFAYWKASTASTRTLSLRCHLSLGGVV